MSRTVLEVARGPAGGRACVVVRSDGPRGRGHLGVRVLSARADLVRAALVAEGAMLVAGDDVALGVRVGAGMALELVEPSGTVAYDMRGGAARWSVEVDVTRDASLVWRAEAFVVATGADVDRSVTVRLAQGATAALRETLVLGRVAETGGVLRQRFRASAGDAPLLVEDLVVDGGQPHVGVLGPHRVVDTVAVLGHRSPPVAAAGAHRLELDGEGTLHRFLGAAAHASPLDPVWAAVSNRRPVEVGT